MSKRPQTVRGFRDILGAEAARVSEFEFETRKLLRRYDFSEVRLPTLEFSELFDKSSGETSDVVEKEMFTFEDSKGRKLALRPEGTPGAVRAFLDSGMAQQGGRGKLFYIGNMFRAERPQKGRYREFEQIGVEYFGSGSYIADAEVIALLDQICRKAGVANHKVEISTLGDENCRPEYRAKLLAFLKKHENELCEDCRRRIDKNPLRALDCKRDGPILAANAPKLERCPDCQAHFHKVRMSLEARGIEFVENQNLVRGLDYYNRTVFEFKADIGEGRIDTIAAGGRYDGLVKSMGGPETPAVGWALGVERTLLAAKLSKPQLQSKKIAVVCPSKDPAVQEKAFEFLQTVRSSDTESASAASSAAADFDTSFKSQMRQANSMGAHFVSIIGDDEFKGNSFIWKDLNKPDDNQKSIPFERLGEIFEDLT